MLVLEDVKARVGSFELSGIDLTVQKGRYLVLMGPTGSGKTTLLNTIAGLLRPLSGRITLDGQDITGLPPEKRPIGYVFQDNRLFPHLTVRENIAFGPRARGLRGHELAERVKWAMELVGVSELADKRPWQLSGGEAKKVALARALALKPRLLLLDEPLAHVDERAREDLMDMLRAIREELAPTVIHVTHDRLEALKLADELALMESGRIIQVGEASSVLRRPASRFVAEFLGYDNILRARCQRSNGLYELWIGDVRLLAVEGREGDVLACLRAEDILLSREPPKTSARNVLKGRVVELRPRGTLIEVRLRVSPELELVSVITPAARAELGVEEGSELYLAFKASSVRVI